MNIKAIIIDDEKHCTATLNYELEKSCPNVEVVGIFHRADEALSQMSKLKPELVFLDIEMPHMNGFEFLKASSQDFGVIFTTAYDEFALVAFQHSAIDYLLKPIASDDIARAVQKFETGRLGAVTASQIEILFNRLEGKGFTKVALPTQEGLEFADPTEIMRCESSSNYTNIHFRDKSRILISKTLKEVEEMLDGHGFFRVHHSHLINLNDIKKYVKGAGGYLVMDDDCQVPVSRSRKERLMELFQR